MKHKPTQISMKIMLRKIAMPVSAAQDFRFGTCGEEYETTSP
jgi:hypothetical protein